MIYLEEPLSGALESISDMISDPLIEEHVETCHQCGASIRSPIIYRKSDVAKLEHIIKLADEWCKDHGVYEDMMYDVMDRIHKSMRIQ